MQTELIKAVVSQITLGMFQSLDWLSHSTYAVLEASGKATSVRRIDDGIAIILDNGSDVVVWQCADDVADAVVEYFAGLTVVEPTLLFGRKLVTLAFGKVPNQFMIATSDIGKDFVGLRYGLPSKMQLVLIDEHKFTTIMIGINKCEVMASPYGLIIRTRRKYVTI